MKVERDYEDLLGSLNKHKVRYCIVGAYAVAFYGYPRYTKDMDILVEPTLENAKRVVEALKAFGFGSLKLTAEDFIREGNIIQLGYEPVRVDILTSITGVSFKDLWKEKRAGKYGRQRVFFIGKDALVRNKKLSARKQDLADLDALKSYENAPSK